MTSKIQRDILDKPQEVLLAHEDAIQDLASSLEEHKEHNAEGHQHLRDIIKLLEERLDLLEADKS